MMKTIFGKLFLVFLFWGIGLSMDTSDSSIYSVDSNARNDAPENYTIHDLQGEWTTNFPGVSFTVTDTKATAILEGDGVRVCTILERDEVFIITGDTNWVLKKKKSSTLTWESTHSKTDLVWYKRSINKDKKETETDEENEQNEDKQSETDEKSEEKETETDEENEQNEDKQSETDEKSEEKETEMDEENEQNEDKESETDKKSKIIWEGWVEDCWILKKESGLREKFGESWFVLYSNGNLEFYYKNKNLVKKRMGNITEGIENYSFGAKFSFMTFTTTKIDWHFKFKKDEHASKWMFFFYEEIKRRRNNKEKEFSVSEETKDINAGKHQTLTDPVVIPKESLDKDQIQFKTTIKDILDFTRNYIASQIFKNNMKRAFKIGTLCNKQIKQLKQQVFDQDEQINITLDDILFDQTNKI